MNNKKITLYPTCMMKSSSEIYKISLTSKHKRVYLQLVKIEHPRFMSKNDASRNVFDSS